MNTTTATAPATINIMGREFSVTGPSAYGTFYLTGPNGAQFATAQAYIGDEHTLKVVSNRELYIKGNRVLLTTKSGTLAVAE